MNRAAEEFREADLGDPRRKERLLKLAASMAEEPDSSFPEALSERDLEAAYRFFSNKGVSLEAILSPHIDATWRRAASDVVTLALHDTTNMSFRIHGKRVGLIPSSRGTQQFLAHTTLAVRGDASRRPYGVLALSTYQLEHDEDVHGRWRKQVEIVANHPSARRNVIHVMDREADDYALLAVLQGGEHRFIVRAQYDRLLEHETMRQALGSVAVADTREVELGARGGSRANNKQRSIHPPRDARLTTLAFAAATLTVLRPKSANGDLPESLTINVVRVWETTPLPGEKAVEWLLLTSEPISTRDEILQIVDWYRTRWVIEEYFKALKSGCSYEKRQLESYHALRNALAFFVPTAWRLLLLRTEARSRPDAPAETVLTQDQLEVLRASNRTKLPPSPTTHDAWLAIAILGGHLRRNGDPGWMVLGRGLQKLDILTAGWCLRKSSERCGVS